MNTTDLHKELEKVFCKEDKSYSEATLKQDFRRLSAFWVCEASCVENCLFFSPTGTGDCSFKVQLEQTNICKKEI